MRRPNIMSWRAKVVTIIMLCSFLLLPVLVVSKISMGSTVEGLYINEVMSSNATTLSDADGAYSDWIELYNAGEEQVDVSGFYLSDDTTKKTKWTFPAQTTIPAKGFLLVWASSSDSSVGTNGELHTNFSIKAGGEPIVLTMPDGVTVIDQLGAQALKDDESYGRYPDGSSQWTTYTKGSATPNASKPIFSQPGGFYVNEFSLVISSNEPDVTIYYTLDGSKPDPANTVTAGKYNIKQDYSGSELLEREKRTYQYSEPLSINRQALDSNSLSYIRTTHSQVPSDRSWKEPSLDNGKAVVVRAIAYRNGVASPCITQTYFIGSEWQNLSLPVVSIIMDPADLFDYENGLYVPGKMFDDSANYSGVWNTWPANYETDWEKPAYVEFYESNGNLGFAQNIGVRMHGEWTRAYPYKSLRLYAKSDYDTKSTFAYDVFPGAKNNNNEDLDHYKRLILKNGGQSFYNTMLPDAIMQSSFNGLGKVDLQYYRPAIEFINGEYWGITNVQERLDKYYLKYHYGVNEDNVAIIEGPYARVEDLVEGDETDCSNYISMRDYAEEKDIRLAENYQHLQSLMDVDSYIDYNVLRIYSGDVDSVTKHMYAWREKNGSGVTDGKWRWQTKDFDGSMAAYDVNRDLLAVSLDPNLSDATILFRKLVTNDDFKNQFINRFADHLNTTFVPSRMETIINQMSSEVSSEIVKHIS